MKNVLIGDLLEDLKHYTTKAQIKELLANSSQEQLRLFKNAFEWLKSQPIDEAYKNMLILKTTIEVDDFKKDDKSVSNEFTDYLGDDSDFSSEEGDNHIIIEHNLAGHNSDFDRN